jgi:hypothetical protein
VIAPSNFRSFASNALAPPVLPSTSEPWLVVEYVELLSPHLLRVITLWHKISNRINPPTVHVKKKRIPMLGTTIPVKAGLKEAY